MTDQETEPEVPLVLGARRRRAYFCPHKECLPPRRTFLFPSDPDVVPRCQEHGRMVEQPNRPYRPSR
jgi:hypothetical protein